MALAGWSAFQADGYETKKDDTPLCGMSIRSIAKTREQASKMKQMVSRNS